VAESIRFDFLSTGAEKLAGDFRKTGDSAALAARGAKVLTDVIKDLGQKEDRTAAQSKILAAALRQTGDAEDRAAAKAVLADAAIRRLDDSMKDSTKRSGELGKALGGLKLNPGLLGPAVALAPALATLGGVATGVAVGLAGAFAAGGAALAAFGAVAKPVLTDAKTAATAVETAQTAHALAVEKVTGQYRIAMSVAKTQAQRNAAYAAEQKGFQNAALTQQLAVNKAYAELSPAQIALSKQIGAMANAWQNVKAAETPVVAGALQPWLKSVTDLTGKLGPIIAGVAPFIQYLGVQFDRLINSAAFARFRDFITGSGSVAVGAAGNAIIDLLKAFITLLPQFAPLINKASGGMLSFAQNVLKWSQSKKASDDITRFMAWFSQNGPVVGALLVNIGLALKALAPGLTTGGATELKLISDFFAFVAKLPPSLAKPLAEVAGALLILNKLGVISVGVKVVGAAAKWLAGGLVELGGGAAAGAEIRTGMVSGGTAAAAEIRGAMVTGGAAGGAEVGGGAAAALKLSAPAIGATIGLAVTAQIAGFLAYKKFSDLFSSGVKGSTAVGQGGSSGQGASIGAVLAGTGTNVAAKLTADLVPANKLLTSLGFSQAAISQINKAILKPGSNVGKVDALIYSLGGTQADILAVNKLIVKPGSSTSNIDALLKRIGLTPPQIAGVNKLNLKPGDDPVHVDAMLKRIGLTPVQIAAANRLILRPHSDTSPVARLQQAINSLHGKTVNVLLHAAGSGSIYFNESTGVGGSVTGGLKFLAGGGKVTGGTPGRDSVAAALMPGEVVVPAHMVQAGAVDHLRGSLPGFAAGGYVPNLGGVENWIGGNEYNFGKTVENTFAVRLIANLKAAVKKAASAMGSPVAYSRVAGVTQWEGTALRALAMLGLPAADLPTVMAQILTESGGNPNAINLTDINAQQGDPSRGLLQLIGTTFAAYRSPSLSSNIYDPLANIYAGLHYAESRYGNPGWLSVLGHGHGYDSGGWLPTGTSIAVNNTGRPEQVIPAGGAGADGGVHLHLTINGPVGSQQQLEDWFVKTANRASRTGRLTQAVKTASR
jgi:SLT domain-containing protein